MRFVGAPTPLDPAPRLAREIGLGPSDLWVKRDDLIGLGGGGNKVRKLQWTVGAALAEGADTLVTSGAPQSNHARLTAAAGARTGLGVVLVLEGSAGMVGTAASSRLPVVHGTGREEGVRRPASVLQQVGSALPADPEATLRRRRGG